MTNPPGGGGSARGTGKVEGRFVQPVAGRGPSSGGSLSCHPAPQRDPENRGRARSRGSVALTPSSLVAVAAGWARASFEPNLAEVPSPTATGLASPISPNPDASPGRIRSASGAAHAVPAVQALVAGATPDSHSAADVAGRRVFLALGQRRGQRRRACRHRGRGTVSAGHPL